MDNKNIDNVYDREAVQCTPTKVKRDLSLLHIIIGFAIIAFFWIVPPFEPITELGMRCVGAFLGMVYLWSAADTMWPSLLGLFLFGISGYDAAGGFNGVWLNAVGNYTVLLTLFAMVLFGAVDEVGDTKYIAKWFLTKKIFKGRPYVFLSVFYACCFALGALVSPITSLIILWPISLGLMSTLGIERCDKIWRFFFVGMFLVSTLAQPFFPFMGAQLVPISAFQGMTAAMGTPMSVPMLPYMLTDLIMTALVMFVYLLLMKFVLRVDVSKLKAVDPVMIEEQMPLPKMNFQQKAYLYMIPLYLIMLLIPNFTKGNPVSDFLNVLGPLGVTVFWVIVFVVVKHDGKPLLNFKEVAYRQFNWGIFFMIAAAVYGANSLSNDATGVVPFLIQVLNPLLGGQPEIVFVALMFTVALIITNFANNAAMAVVLLPIAITFSNQLGIDPIPVVMGIILMVFVAMLTPAASPHAGMMHGRKDIYTTSEILKIGLPMCAITLILYVLVGYPLMKALLAMFGA